VIRWQTDHASGVGLFTGLGYTVRSIKLMVFIWSHIQWAPVANGWIGYRCQGL